MLPLDYARDRKNCYFVYPSLGPISSMIGPRARVTLLHYFRGKKIQLSSRETACLRGGIANGSYIQLFWSHHLKSASFASLSE